MDTGKIPEIPGFELVKRCGTGRSCEVWLGLDRYGEQYAVRVVNKKCGDPLLEAERRAVHLYLPLSRGHANLLKILDHGETPDCLYSIMEPADNISCGYERYEPDTLDRRLKRNRLTTTGILKCLESILSGIQYLHECGMAHGDLKPENIMFVGRVLKIGDPGLVSSSKSCSPGGTAGFRPPWKAQGKERDIYAFGKMVYMLCTQEKPQCFPEIPARCDLSSIMPLNEIALGCCEYDPHRRFRDADEIRRALRRVRW